ncbi:BTAD domain-containing putative transcriptional regulator [Streptacidiphilus neutrinimicus]|uniref:BTAD domain-containing putative transcriptional regulator n=1 Tax=Streptacidiphilus neutrinimicus TaxID=105420 RepID=UPI000A9389B4|nr:BTAD domain-containing putative transcriptional regulator [Streptacidiphilus neutrinimicus]
MVQALFVIGLLTVLPLVLTGTPQLSTALGTGLPSTAQVIATAEQPVDDRLLFAVLALTGWITWGVLALSVLLEIGWALRHLSALRGSTGIALVTARRTLGSLLIGGILIALLTATRPPATAGGMSAGGSPLLAPVAATAPLHPAAETPGVDTVTVRPGDTLWQLADSRLGDPLRWPEIYAANRNDTETDGRRFVDPNLIYPGWTLNLPGAQPAPPVGPAPHTTSSPVSSPAPAGGQGDLAPVPAPPVPRREHGPAESRHAASRASHGLRLPREAGYVSVALAAALAVNALRVKRRRTVHVPDGEEPPTLEQVRQRPEHHPLIADLRALQAQENLATQKEVLAGVPLGEQPGKLLPLDELLQDLPVRALSVIGPGAEDAVRALLLHVLTPQTSPAATVVTTADDLHQLLGSHSDGALPARILGTDGIDEALARVEEQLIGRVRDQHEQSDGGCAPAPLYLVTSQLPDRQRRRLLSMLDVGAGLGVRAILVQTKDDEGATVEVHHDGTARLLGHATGPLRIFHLRLEGAQAFIRLLQAAESPSSRSNEDPTGESAPDRTQAPVPPQTSAADPEMESLADPKAEGDDEPDPDGNGSDSDLAPVPEMPQGLPCNSAESAPATATRQAEQRVSVCQVAEPPQPHVAPVALTLFGPFTVHVNGTPQPSLSRGKLGELLAYLAVHDEGVAGESIWQDLWPDRDNTSARDTFYRTSSNARTRLRETLEAGQSAQLILGNGTGRWHLDPRHFQSDLAAFHQARREAATAPSPQARRSARERAAALHQGELCAGSTFGWIDPYREHARIQAVAVLTELARTSEGIDEALSRLQQATTLAPTDEALYLEQAQLHVRTGNLAAVRRTRDLMTRALAEIDTRPTPATSRAFEDLLRAGGHPSAKARATP